MKSIFTPLLCSILAFTAARSSACDLCGCSILNHPWEPRAGFFFGATEQFTHFNTIQVDGHEIDNDAGQSLDGSNTQLFLGYNITRRFSMQVNVPLIRAPFAAPPAIGSRPARNPASAMCRSSRASSRSIKTLPTSRSWRRSRAA